MTRHPWRLVALATALAVLVAIVVGMLAPAKAEGVTDANGNPAIVRSQSGHKARVHPSAQAALQCVVDYVEARGVRITALRGYGRGTVHGSLHPSGRALDINQTARNRTRPRVPPAVANGAADHCGVISGARWHNADNGHWNLQRRAGRGDGEQ